MGISTCGTLSQPALTRRDRLFVSSGCLHSGEAESFVIAHPDVITRTANQAHLHVRYGKQRMTQHYG
jgi:hypothetical protein